MNLNTSVIIGNDIAEVEKLAQAVESVCRSCRLPEATMHELLIAVEEVAVNVISYAYGEAGRRSIQADLCCEGSVMVVRISDDGRPFNPLEVAPPDIEADLEERQVGGLGIHLVRRLMSSVSYERQKGRNILTLRKEWPAR